MPRPKKAPKVSVSKKFDTKTAIRTAFNALKATGNLPGPAGRPGKVAQVAEKAYRVAEKVYRVAQARKMTETKPGPVKTMKGDKIPESVKQMIKDTVSKSSYSKPVHYSVLRKVDKAISKKTQKERYKKGEELSSKFKTSKEGQSKSLIVPKHLRGKRFNWKKDL